MGHPGMHVWVTCPGRATDHWLLQVEDGRVYWTAWGGIGAKPKDPHTAKLQLAKLAQRIIISPADHHSIGGCESERIGANHSLARAGQWGLRRRAGCTPSMCSGCDAPRNDDHWVGWAWPGCVLHAACPVLPHARLATPGPLAPPHRTVVDEEDACARGRCAVAAATASAAARRQGSGQGESEGNGAAAQGPEPAELRRQPAELRARLRAPGAGGILACCGHCVWRRGLRRGAGEHACLSPRPALGAAHAGGPGPDGPLSSSFSSPKQRSSRVEDSSAARSGRSMAGGRCGPSRRGAVRRRLWQATSSAAGDAVRGGPCQRRAQAHS
jgi:hypothetical protein